MTRPIEAVVAEALRLLETTGTFDINTFVQRHPEHADELRQLLPTMLDVSLERRWQETESRSHDCALGLFAELSQAVAPTVGALFQQELGAAGSILAHAQRTGLTPNVLAELSQDQTPTAQLDNAAIKRLATRVSAPFAALAKEIRRLMSVRSLGSGSPQAVFTRERETSTDAERQALVEQVQRAAAQPKEPPDADKE